MIRTVIVDDEHNGREGLNNILETYFADTIKVVDTAKDVKSAVETINGQNPDLVFLDIKMPDGTGFDVLQQVKPEVNCQVIFVTAYDEFAIRAFEYSAFGYLLKPIKIKSLRETLDRFFTAHEANEVRNRNIKVLVENYEAGAGQIKKLIVPNLTGFDVLEIKNIIRLEGEKNYTRFIIKDQKSLLISKTLKTYEDLLAEHGFIRVHQSTIINLQHVVRYLKGDGGEVEMSDGVLVNVARQRKDALLQRFL